ncbi:MAG: hypothetical protein RI949_2505 [Pseudomonadota bacterium]|jgi:nucleoside-diphosphate-sugar epimerase
MVRPLYPDVKIEEMMDLPKHVVVFGATGVVGNAACRHFATLPGWTVTAVSRRSLDAIAGVRSISVDLRDANQAWSALSHLTDVTHVVFAAYAIEAGTSGWREPGQMDANLALLKHALDPLLAGAPRLRHVSLLQGTKAYGEPDAVIPIPAKESAPRAPHAIFYWLQEDFLKKRLRQGRIDGDPWSWTVLRPQIVFGVSWGSHMNLLPAIGAYAAVLKQEGSALHFPGGPSWTREAVDADLLAHALAWAANSPSCQNEIFNITNGDVFEWRNVWPAIAQSLGMPVGDDRPLSLAQTMPSRQGEWASVVRTHQLRSPASLMDFVGQGFTYADRQFCHGRSTPPPARLVSTIKARQAGFSECIDTTLMFQKHFDSYQRLRWLPAPR